eukprot:TRINITY_DN3423_c0_g1_i2.p2 TRINITY_DN3423_c0_g1~~TRINITY_DN3423_c0_g1_i2.p2  ORF type:complete len:318 (+),score=48.50 TRINITY_DN3423_c0_g1_i2:323-1276(+)
MIVSHQDDQVDLICVSSYLVSSPRSIIDDHVMSYFRALCQKDEISERMFHLTSAVILKLCGNYTAWYYRKLCLEALKKDLREELEFIELIIYGNEKSYQLWEQRRYIIDLLGDPSREFAFINDVLEADNKNYHAWSYRKWLVERFNLQSEDLKRMDLFFEEDSRNNSAWNHRFFLLHKSLKTREDLERELKYVSEFIRRDPQNESTWNYLNGWFKSYELDQADAKRTEELSKENIYYRIKNSYSDFPEVKALCDEIIHADPEHARFAWTTLLNIYLCDKSHRNPAEINKTLNELIRRDPIRTKYYEWLRQRSGVAAS